MGIPQQKIGRETAHTIALGILRWTPTRQDTAVYACAARVRPLFDVLAQPTNSTGPRSNVPVMMLMALLATTRLHHQAASILLGTIRLLVCGVLLLRHQVHTMTMPGNTRHAV